MIHRSGSRYLSVFVSACGIQMREVVICDARVMKGAGVRTLPTRELPGSLCPCIIAWHNFSKPIPDNHGHDAMLLSLLQCWAKRDDEIEPSQSVAS